MSTSMSAELSAGIIPQTAKLSTDVTREKDVEVGAASSQTTASHKEASIAENAVDWTPEEENRLVRKSVLLQIKFAGCLWHLN